MSSNVDMLTRCRTRAKALSLKVVEAERDAAIWRAERDRLLVDYYAIRKEAAEARQQAIYDLACELAEMERSDREGYIRRIIDQRDNS